VRLAVFKVTAAGFLVFSMLVLAGCGGSSRMETSGSAQATDSPAAPSASEVVASRAAVVTDRAFAMVNGSDIGRGYISTLARATSLQCCYQLAGSQAATIVVVAGSGDWISFDLDTAASTTMPPTAVRIGSDWTNAPDAVVVASWPSCSVSADGTLSASSATSAASRSAPEITGNRCMDSWNTWVAANVNGGLSRTPAAAWIHTFEAAWIHTFDAGNCAARFFRDAGSAATPQIDCTSDFLDAWTCSGGPNGDSRQANLVVRAESRRRPSLLSVIVD
jgi:hypothetical protein